MKCRLKIALLFFFSFLGLLRCYRELLSIEVRPKINESLRLVKDLPFLPPYFQFPVDYFTAYQYNITTCSIRKSMSQMVFNTMCLLHDPESFLEGNHTISETWESNRTCNYEDEDGFATFPDVYKNSSTFTRIVFIRDPFDRFLSFYLDKCVRKGFCFDCLDDMRCVLENIYKSLREQYLGDIRYVANFIGLHSAPISWFCDFDKYLKAYHIMVIGPGKKEREEPIRRFSEILKKKKVPEKIISKIVKESLCELGELGKIEITNYVKVCKGVPVPDPWDPSILKFHDFSETQQLNCEASNVQPEITYLNETGFLHVNSTESVKCSFRSYEKSPEDDENLVFSEWREIENAPIKIFTEFIEVECRKTTFPRSKIYSNNHFQVITKNGGKKGDSVFVIVLDSVSHSNFIRNMNKTLKILRENYKTHIFDGMTKVGDNSFENAAVFFAGRKPNEFHDAHGFFDDYEMIWDFYKKSGFATFYSEDYPQFNLFNYLAKGFKKKPVDYYFRPFWLNTYGSYVHRRSKYLCYGNQAMHKLQLDYLSKFLRTTGKKFGIAWFTELGHDWLNQIRLGDQDFAEFLVKNEEKLGESWLIVMADHGHRFDRIRGTRIGRIEERLPFFSIAMPRRLRGGDMDKVLGKNKEKLTSFWDVYQTLHELSGNLNIPPTPRGLSLLSPLPDRSCQQAEIPEEFCVCQEEPEMSLSSPVVLELAEKLVHYLNEQIDVKKCAEMSLKRILSATEVVGEGKYRIGVEVAPSGGEFEALMDENGVFGDVNRINKYGNQSICIDDNQFLKKICFCLQFLVK